MKLTTITDATRIISDWIENYLEQPTEEQIERAARSLVEFVGGYEIEFEKEDLESFDLDATLI